MLIFLASLAALGASGPATSSARPPVSIWMNNNRSFREGDQVKLQVDTDVDGYLLVLNYQTDGGLRILFPLDPREDALVHAGRRYEVRDEGGDAAFRAGADGSGVIYTAVAREPWRFDDITLNDRWDYARITLAQQQPEDPEASITEFVQQLSGPGGFDYDVAGYRVYGPTAVHDDYVLRGPYYGYPDYLYCSDWYWRYDGCRFGPYSGGWSLTFGYYPFGYYSPYGYGYSPYYPYYQPYYPYRPVGPGGRRPVVIGRPRAGGVISRPGGGTGRFGSAGVLGSNPTRHVTLPPVNWRPRSEARPSSRAGSGALGSSAGGGRVSAPPPARRVRQGPSGIGRPSTRSAEARPSGSGNGSGYFGRPAPQPSRGEAPRARPAPQPSRGEVPRARPAPQPSRGAAPRARPAPQPSRGAAPPARSATRGGSGNGRSSGGGGGHASPPRSGGGTAPRSGGHPAPSRPRHP
jgi:Domain of unknown function (DUF4384)